MLERGDDLIRVWGLDGDVLARLASLGASLHAHQQFDILNRQHCHHLGKAISVAGEFLHVDCTKRLWTVKENADNAQNECNNVSISQCLGFVDTVDVWTMLEGAAVPMNNDNDTLREVPHLSNEGLALQARA